MIMDIAQQLRAPDLKMAAIMENAHHSSNNNKNRDLSTNNSQSATNVAVTKKRSFDVAFLMQPDEKFQSKVVDFQPSPRKMFHSMAENNIAIKADALLRQMGSPGGSSILDDSSSVGRNSTDSPTNEEIDIMTNGNSNSSFGSANPLDTASIQESVRYFRTQVNRNISHNNNNNSSPRVFTTNSPSLSDLEVHRSAFTKVPHVRLDSPPVPPLSPDRLSCSSISPPAVSTTPPRQFTTFHRSSSNTDYGFPSQFHPFMQQSSMGPHYPGHPGLSMGSPPGSAELMGTSKSPMKQQHPSQQYFYRPPSQEQQQQMSNGYSPFPLMTSTPPASPQMHPFSNELARHPAAAAAILSSLIPPTISSAFSLAAQNVCAKCNISFRMTSDLVYHMRSHHKSENVHESYRRKREDKLKCPVCNESFRERHHLTRHMTAHQDKASDDAEPPPQTGRNSSHQQMIMGQEFKGRHNGLMHSLQNYHNSNNKGH